MRGSEAGEGRERAGRGYAEERKGKDRTRVGPAEHATPGEQMKPLRARGRGLW